MKPLHSLGLLTLVLASGTTAFAQTATTGGFAGTATDAQGKPIVGATVRIASSQVTRTVLTGDNGGFRIPLLNPGAFTLTVSKPGFTTITQKVEVALNELRSINLRMAAENTATVEVIAANTGVDTTTTTQGAAMTGEKMDMIPMGRDFNTAILLTPGVQSLTGGFSISGASVLENSFITDGLETTDLRFGQQGSTLPKEFVDQVEVQTGSFKPEYSALGGVILAVTKSGTNDFVGSTWVDWDPRGLMPKPIVTLNVHESNYNDNKYEGLTVGGPLIKDKLFYFVGVHANQQESGDKTKTNRALDLYDSQWTLKSTLAYGKLNWFPSPDHQLSFAYQMKRERSGQADVYNNGANYVSPANWGSQWKNDSRNWNLFYDWTINSAMTLSAKLGQTYYDSAQVPTNSNVLVRDRLYYTSKGAGGTSNPMTAGFSYFTGGIGAYTKADNATNKQFKLDFTWYLGNHSLKTGISQQNGSYTQGSDNSGGYTITINKDGAGNFKNVEKGIYKQDATVDAKWAAWYIQDQWELVSGVKLSYGARYESNVVNDPKGNAFFKFTDFGKQLQPRLSLIWDPNGDGQSKITAGVARYFEKIPMRTPMRQGGTEIQGSYFWTPTDPVNHATYDKTQAVPWSVTGPGNFISSSAAFSNTPKAEGLKLPERWEYVLGYEKNLAEGLKASINYRYRDLKNGFEDTVFVDAWGRPADPDPVTGQGRAIFWNPGTSNVSYTRDGVRYNVGPEYTSLFPKTINKYHAVDLILDKQTSTWFARFAYTWSHGYGNYEGVAQDSVGQLDANGNQAYDFWPLVNHGDMPFDRRHTVNLVTGYTFKVLGNPLKVSAIWKYMSGKPRSITDDGSLSNGYAPSWDSNHWAQTADGKYWAVNTDAAYNAGANWDSNGYWIGPSSQLHRLLDFHGILYNYAGDDVVKNNQWGNAGRFPAQTSLDLKLAYEYRFTARFRLSPSAEIFNVFNRRVPLYDVTRAGDKNEPNEYFGMISQFQAGRTYKFGLKFDF